MKEMYHTTKPVLLLALAGVLGAGLLMMSAGCIPPPPECTADSGCDDGLYCNGAETCVNEVCVDGTAPCAEGETCDEDAQTCTPPTATCGEDTACDDGLYCNGAETCADGFCADGTAPCADTEVCDEDGDACTAATCAEDADCDDGLFCTGTETCTDTVCVAGTSPCSADEECDEEGDACTAIEIVSPYEASVLDAFFKDADPAHPLGDAHSTQSCDVCHHSDPSSAGQGCRNCHGDEAFFDEDLELNVPALKDAMHAPVLDSGKQGCRGCHAETNDDGSWVCAHCHTDF